MTFLWFIFYIIYLDILHDTLYYDFMIANISKSGFFFKELFDKKFNHK